MALTAEYGFLEGSGFIATDSSGNGRDITLRSDSMWDTGVISGAGAVKSETLLNVANAQEMGPTDLDGFTFMTWVNIYAPPEDEFGDYDIAWFQSDTTEYNRTLYGFKNADGAGVGYYTSQGNKSDANTTAYGYNEWFHIALTLDGTNPKVYLNGDLVVTAEDWLVVWPTDVYLTGADLFGTRYDMNGKIAEVRTFDEALDTPSINTWMNTHISSRGSQPWEKAYAGSDLLEGVYVGTELIWP